MSNLKTKKNPRGAGRKKGEETRVVSLRIRKNVYDALVGKYGTHWNELFRDFCRVYKLFEDENGSLKLKDETPIS